MSQVAYESIPLERFQEVFKDTSTEVSSEALGGKIVSFSDEFFAEAENLLKVHPSASMKGQFGPKGALYDGWETRRHNAPDHDWVVIRLGASSSILTGFDIDTANFSGNEGPAADVWGLKLQGDEKEIARQEKTLRGDDIRWERLLPVVPLGPNSRHLFKIEPTQKVYSHVKLTMIPDGGFGRFRAYGIPQPPPTTERIDLAYALNGGRVVAQSDQHFGIASNLLLPGRGVDMGDGWESKRSRTQGNREWTVIRLGDAGYIDHVEIDTAYHMGNFPMYASLDAINTQDNVPSLDDSAWTSILPKMKQGPHRQHFYPAQNAQGKVFTHIRLSIWPDGGLKRLRIFGYRASLYPDSLPSTHATNPIPQVEALPLTYEAFLPFGKVIQGYSAPTAAPRGIQKTTANQGTAAKYHKMALIENDLEEDHKTIISVQRSLPRLESGKVNVWNIVQLEKHPRSTQTFVPFGSTDATGKGSATAAGSYIVTAALSDANGQPDLATLRSFVAMPSQGISWNRDVWHHGTLVLNAPITFAAIEAVVPPSRETAIAFYKPGGTIAQITIPQLPLQPGLPKETTHESTKSSSGAFGALKSIVSSLSGSNIPCEPLTSQGFKAYGEVIQNYANPSDVPEGIDSMTQPDGMNTRLHDLAFVRNSYPKEAGAATGVSVFRCTVKEGMIKGKPWPVHFLERHPHTEQTFIPMGISTLGGQGEEALPGGAAYIVIVASTGSDGQADPSTLRAFFCTAEQGVNYRTGVWHHPMLTLNGPIDFACIETQITHLGDARDCELAESQIALGVVDIPDF